MHFSVEAHAFPQLPQFFASLVTSAQVPPQSVAGGLQDNLHAPLTQ
jgi:hypothetical protein